MKLDGVLSYLMCVECGGALAAGTSDRAESLRCEACGRVYPIKNGIPILLKGRTEETHYDIPWHPVQARAGTAHSLKKRLKNAIVSAPFLKLFVYKVLYGPNKLYLTEEVNKRIGPGAVVADIGCRNIPYVSSLKRVKVYFAVDIDFASLQYIHSLQLANVVPILASVETMPLRSGTIDSLVCLEVIEHVEDDRSAFAEMGRVLRKDGSLFLTTPDGDTVSVDELPPPRLHLRHYKRVELEEFLSRECGAVKIESIASWFPFWRVTDHIEAMHRRQKSRIRRLAVGGAYFLCNFVSNICHAVCEQTAYRSRGHYRFVAKCVK